jgi:hypothetical protein
MAYKNLKEFITYLNRRTYQSINSYGKEVSVSISIEHDGEKKVFVDHQDRENIRNIRNLVKFNPYDIIHVDIHVDDKTICFSYDARKVNESDFSNDEKAIQGDFGQKKVRKSEKMKDNKEIQSDFSEQKAIQRDFRGFGEAEVQSIIEKRLAEEKTKIELSDLKEKVQKKDQKIANLKKNIDELETKLDEAAQEQDRLEGIIKLKENIRYYAGFAGDVLESIGLDKRKLRQPLAGLMQEDEQHQTQEQTEKQIAESTSDESGIVEDQAGNPNESVIGMINEFLKRVDDETLAYIYEILVFIEKDKQTAFDLYTHLNQQLSQQIKEEENANI